METIIVTVVSVAGAVAILVVGAWYSVQKDREESKRWQQAQETERRERELEMEAMRLGYVQERYLASETPGDMFKSGFNPPTHKVYALRWVKLAVIENSLDKSFSDLFAQMCNEYGIVIGKDTWEEGVAKINKVRTELRDLKAKLAEIQQSQK